MKLCRLDSNEEIKDMSRIFKCGECNKNSYTSEMKIFFDLNKTGEFEITKSGIFRDNSIRIVCTMCYDELNN